MLDYWDWQGWCVITRGLRLGDGGTGITGDWGHGGWRSRGAWRCAAAGTRRMGLGLLESALEETSGEGFQLRLRRIEL